MGSAPIALDVFFLLPPCPVKKMLFLRPTGGHVTFGDRVPTFLAHNRKLFGLWEVKGRFVLAPAFVFHTVSFSWLSPLAVAVAPWRLPKSFFLSSS